MPVKPLTKTSGRSSVGRWRFNGALTGVFVLIASAGTVAHADVRHYQGPGDVRRLVNLWNANRSEFEGTVRGIDTFSGLGTVESISSAADGNGSQIVVALGLSAQVSCSNGALDVGTGETVSVSGRIDRVAPATSLPGRNAAGSDKDSLELRDCTVRKALNPKK